MDESGHSSSIIKGKSRIPRKPRVILAACGCIDATKFGPLCYEFSKWAKLGAVVTESSLPFIARGFIPKDVIVLSVGSPEAYLQWADIMVIAPLSANSLAKISGGLCDDLLSCIARGWDYSKPFFVAPSMDPSTWRNPFTQLHCVRIKNRGITVIPPASGKVEFLASSDEEGEDETGAMPEPSEISYTVRISNEIYWG